KIRVRRVNRSCFSDRLPQNRSSTLDKLEPDPICIYHSEACASGRIAQEAGQEFPIGNGFAACADAFTCLPDIAALAEQRPKVAGEFFWLLKTHCPKANESAGFVVFLDARR